MTRRHRGGAQLAPERLLRTADIPQADRLENVRVLAAAVREGIHHPTALLELLDVDARHFHYYRQAAEILGLLAVQPDRTLVLTDQGRGLLSTAEGSLEERRSFHEAILAARSLKPFAWFFEGQELSLEALSERLQAMTALSASTAERRAKTLLQWRRYIHEKPFDPAGPSIPDLTPQLESLIARHNALAKQSYLEWMLQMEPAAFEQQVAALVRAMGHTEVKVTGRSGDGGIDITATRPSEWGGLPTLIIIQAKRYSRPVGRRAVDELIGVLTRGRYAAGKLVTTSGFSTGAQQAAAQEGRIELINGVQLVDRLAHHGVGIRFGRHGELVPATPPTPSS